MVKASIIVTCYNLEKYITRAINSCLNQNFPENEYEIIIIDDGSSDNSRSIISLYKNFNFIRTKFIKKNRGVAYASNVGFKMAKGKYVVRVDGDDYIHKNFLQTMTQVLDWNPDVGFVHCDLIIAKGIGGKNQRKFQLNTFERLLDHGAGVMFRKKYLSSIGFYNEKLINCEDYDLILRYSKKYKGYHLRLPYYRYFKRKDGLSAREAERKRIKKYVVEENNKK